MDDNTRRAAMRLDRLADYIQAGMVVLVALLFVLAASIVFLIFVLARVFGIEGPD